MEPGIGALYAQLRDLALSANQGQQYELYRALEDNKTRLLALFDFGQRNARDRHEVETGTR
jgi:hypothetical protein